MLGNILIALYALYMCRFYSSTNIMQILRTITFYHFFLFFRILVLRVCDHMPLSFSSAAVQQQPHFGSLSGSQMKCFLCDKQLRLVLLQEANSCRRNRIRTSKLLQDRELCGNFIASSKGRCNFNVEFQKTQVSCPVVCILLR